MVYSFNETADRYVLRPVAKGYDTVMPDIARAGVRNFFSNLFYPTVIVNDVLQLKLLQSGQDLSRFLVNSTFGLGGLLDVATPTGIPENDEDFGQTLGYWGVGPGWYLMLPLFGPSNNRDLVGRFANSATSILPYVDEPAVTYGLSVLHAVDDRAALLGADQFLEQQLDRYVFVRSIYLQNRQNKVYDGNPPKEDFGFDDDSDAAADAAAIKEASEE